MKPPIRWDLEGEVRVELRPALHRNLTANQNTGVLFDGHTDQSAVRILLLRLQQPTYSWSAIIVDFIQKNDSLN